MAPGAPFSPPEGSSHSPEARPWVQSESPPSPCVTVGQALHLSGRGIHDSEKRMMVAPSRGGSGVRSVGPMTLLASALAVKCCLVAAAAVGSYFIQKMEVRLTKPASPGFSSFRRISDRGFVVRCFFKPTRQPGH